MPQTPDSEDRSQQHDDLPIWAARPADPAWEAPVEEPTARARFAVGERRGTARRRVAGKTAGLMAVGALMVAGIAGAALADTGSSPTGLVASGSTDVGSSSAGGGSTTTDQGTSTDSNTSSNPGTTTDPGGGTTGSSGSGSGGSGSGGSGSGGSGSGGSGSGGSTGGGSTGGSTGTSGNQTTGGRTTKPAHKKQTHHRRRHHRAKAAPKVAPKPAVRPAVSALQFLQLHSYMTLGAPPAALPDLREMSHHMTRKLLRLQHTYHVAWTVLAAVRKMKTRHHTSLETAAAWLHHHHAHRRPNRPFQSENALTHYYHNASKGERAVALAAYYWAIGRTGVSRGLAADRGSLSQGLLSDPRVNIYPGGRYDLAAQHVDPRVLMVMRYLEAAFGTVRISCLISGHSYLTDSGNVSAHVFGRAVDVAAVGGVDILGHQGPGTVTERAVRLLLMLPRQVAPKQIISLMDLDGPTGNTGSFALPDHYNHIHVGY